MVPPEFVRPITDDRYDIPVVGTSKYSDYTQATEQEKILLSTTDQGQAILPVIDGVEVKGDGRLRWIVIEKNVEVIWPLIKQFWEQSGFVIETNIPSAGIIETEWAERRAKAPDGTGINQFFTDVFDNFNSKDKKLVGIGLPFH